MIVVRVRENVIKCSTGRASETFSEILAELKETETQRESVVFDCWLFIRYNHVLLASFLQSIQLFQIVHFLIHVLIPAYVRTNGCKPSFWVTRG